MPSIDGAVIKAAYVARLKKYHPDVFKGDNGAAEHMTQDLNEAFDVLGNPDRRREYDALRKSHASNMRPFEADNAIEISIDEEIGIDEKWKYVADYYPEAQKMYEELDQISPSLSFSFKSIVLETKSVEHARKISEDLRVEFMGKNFGHDKLIHEFVFAAFREGRRDIAIEVYKVIRFLGYPSADRVKSFLQNVERKFAWNYLSRYAAKPAERKVFAPPVESTPSKFLLNAISPDEIDAIDQEFENIASN